MKLSNASRIFLSTASAGVIAGFLALTVAPAEQTTQRLDDRSASKTQRESKKPRPKTLNMPTSRRLSHVGESSAVQLLA